MTDAEQRSWREDLDLWRVLAFRASRPEVQNAARDRIAAHIEELEKAADMETLRNYLDRIDKQDLHIEQLGADVRRLTIHAEGAFAVLEALGPAEKPAHCEKCDKLARYDRIANTWTIYHTVGCPNRPPPGPAIAETGNRS